MTNSERHHESRHASTYAVWRTCIWLAQCWLTRRRFRMSSGAAALTIVTTIMLATWAVGLSVGYYRVQRHRIERDPLRLSLWLHGEGAPNTILNVSEKEMVAHPDLAAGIVYFGDLRDRMSQAAGPDFRGCYPFHVLNWRWVRRTDEGQPVWLEFRGRTLVPGDPFFQQVRFRKGSALGDDDQGVVVTPSFLEDLGFEEDPTNWPNELTLRVSWKEQPVQVIGVTDRELPQRFKYVVTASYRRRLLEEDRPKRTRSIDTGPVPAGWPAPEDLPERIKSLLERYGLGIPTQHERHDKIVWTLSTRDESAVSTEYWETWVRRVHEVMEEMGFASREEFYKELQEREPLPDDDRQAITRFVWDHAYDRAVVYVREAAALQLVYSAATRDPNGTGDSTLGATDTDDTIKRVTELDEAAGQAFWLLAITVGFVCGGAVFNLFVIMVLRIQQKTAEIGMLKALGMTSNGIRRLCILEGLFLWLVSALFGAFVAILSGRLVGPMLLASGDADAYLEEVSLSFYWGWPLLASLVVVSLVVCLLTTVFATWWAVTKSPIETVTTN